MEFDDFHKIVLARLDHRLLTSDMAGYSLMNHDIFSPFESYIVEEDRDAFLSHVHQEDHEWFPVTLIHGEGNNLVFLRVMEETDQEFIHLLAADATEVIRNHRLLTKHLEAYEAAGNLSNHVYFYYSPATDEFYLNSPIPTYYANGICSLSVFEEQLLTHTPEKEKEQVRSFVADLRSLKGRFAQVIDANILTDDGAFSKTWIMGCTVFHKEGSVGVTGILRVGKERGAEAEPNTYKRDDLTGLLSRESITRVVKERIAAAGDKTGVLAVLDIDYFKEVNDTYGHRQGDKVLTEVAGIVQAEIGQGGIAGRFGGDEFLLLLFNPDMDSVRNILGNIKNMVRATFPSLGHSGDQALTVSIGSAEFPRYSRNYEEIFLLADYCLYLAKAKGRNRFITYIPEKHGTLEEIRLSGVGRESMNEREETTPGEMLVDMMYRANYGRQIRISVLLEEFAKRFDIPNVFLLSGVPYQMKGSAGIDSIVDGQVRRDVVDMMNRYKDALEMNDFLAVNISDSLPSSMEEVKQFLRDAEIPSFMYIRFKDADDFSSVLLLTANGKRKQWNQQQFKYYRLFTDILNQYHLTED